MGFRFFLREREKNNFYYFVEYFNGINRNLGGKNGNHEAMAQESHDIVDASAYSLSFSINGLAHQFSLSPLLLLVLLSSD